MYHMVRRTPKRKAAGSNPVRDAKNSAESLDLSRFSAFLIYPNPCLSNYHTAYQVVCLFMSYSEYFADWTRTKNLVLANKNGFFSNSLSTPDFAARSVPPVFVPAPEIFEAVQSVRRDLRVVSLAVPAEAAHFSDSC